MVQGPSYAAEYIYIHIYILLKIYIYHTHAFAKMALPGLARARIHQFPLAQGRVRSVQWPSLPCLLLQAPSSGKRKSQRRNGDVIWATWPAPTPAPHTPESRLRKPTGNGISQLPNFAESRGGVATQNWWVKRQGGDGVMAREKVVTLLCKR